MTRFFTRLLTRFLARFWTRLLARFLTRFFGPENTLYSSTRTKKIKKHYKQLMINTHFGTRHIFHLSFCLNPLLPIYAYIYIYISIYLSLSIYIYSICHIFHSHMLIVFPCSNRGGTVGFWHLKSKKWSEDTRREASRKRIRTSYVSSFFVFSRLVCPPPTTTPRNKNLTFSGF